MELTNSKRVLRSASYVITELSPAEERQLRHRDGRALEKINFIRLTGIRPEDVAAAKGMTLGKDFDALEKVVLALTPANAGASTNLSLGRLAGSIPPDLLISAAVKAGDRVGKTPKIDFAIEALRRGMRTAPVGRLHLERIEMYPAGVQRGELIFTVPLAPKETVTISHKEWSTSGEEYERIVQDYFESYSERGVAEKTDVSMSTENEAKHSSAFNFSVNASGGYGPVSMTISTGLNTSAEDRSAQKESLQRTREVTEKASARTRQEHKVSAKLESRRGVEDTSFRTITNPHEDRALRIDYYRMMRKWRTDLFRYGLRLTFDIAIPNPGARLWALYRRIHELDKKIQEPFVFPLMHDSLNKSNWQSAANTYSVVLAPPPETTYPVRIPRSMAAPQGGTEIFDFVAPDGYEFRPSGGFIPTEAPVSCVGIWYSRGSTPNAVFPPGSTVTPIPAPGGQGGTFTVASGAAAGGKRTGWVMMYLAYEGLVVTVEMIAHLTDAALSDWQMRSWTTLRDAAFAAFQTENARLQSERDELWRSLVGKDTLTLRRLEREELMRQVLYWLVGPELVPAPYDVGQVVIKLLTTENFNDDSSTATMHRVLPETDFENVVGYGDIVKYFHNAVEWENLLYFLYPYFWGSYELGAEKILFEHPDPTHQQFLRAGYVRVVVPIKPGFEKSFSDTLDTGDLSSAGDTPYITIAENVAAFARTNYAGVPPANPEKHARPLLYPEQRSTWETMQAVIKLLEEYYTTNKKYPTSLAVLAGAPFKDAWGNELVYKNPGTGNDYDLISYGADGVEDGPVGSEGLNADISAAAGASLVASWFDYTPTSGIDIEIDSKMENIS